MSAHASTSHGPVRAEQEPGHERGGRGPDGRIGGAPAGELEEVERLVVAVLGQELPGVVELLAA